MFPPLLLYAMVRISHTCHGNNNLIFTILQMVQFFLVHRAKRLKPAYDCDRWENKTRTCWLDRNVGDTVTFVLGFAEGASPRVRWRHELHVLHSKKTRHYDIDPGTHSLTHSSTHCISISFFYSTVDRCYYIYILFFYLFLVFFFQRLISLFLYYVSFSFLDLYLYPRSLLLYLSLS